MSAFQRLGPLIYHLAGNSGVLDLGVAVGKAASLLFGLAWRHLNRARAFDEARKLISHFRRSSSTEIVRTGILISFCSFKPFLPQNLVKIGAFVNTSVQWLIRTLESSSFVPTRAR